MNDVSARDVLSRHEATLRRVPGVSGVGLGEAEEGQEVIVVFARHDIEDLDAVRARVPEKLDGYQTQIRPEIRVFPGQGQEGDQDNGG